MGVKSETAEVIKKSAKLLQDGSFKEVTAYLNEVNANRPDLFFKDSDTEGDLAAIYTFAEIMTAEEKAGKKNLISYSADYRELVKLYVSLKQLLTNGLTDDTLYRFILEKDLSTEFVSISVCKIMEEDREQRIRIFNYLANSYLNDRNLHSARIYLGLALAEE